MRSKLIGTLIWRNITKDAPVNLASCFTQSSLRLVSPSSSSALSSIRLFSATSSANSQYFYTASHEYALLSDDKKSAKIGVSDHAQELLGNVVYVEVPENGSEVTSKEPAGAVESVKAYSDVYAPLSGTIINTNSALESSPSLINELPLKEGWIYEISPSDLTELDELMNEADYKEFLEKEE